MNTKKLCIILFLFSLIFGCSEKTNYKKKIVEISTPFVIPKINSKGKEYIFYSIDTAKSKIHWNCSYHFGNLKYKKGTLVLYNQEITEAIFTVDMNSITNTDIEYELMQGTLVNVLKSAEFFNTEVYPEAYFELNSDIKLDRNNYKLSGDFTIFDTGICTDFEGIIKLEKDSLYFNTKPIILDRTDWGMYYLSEKNLYPKEGETGFVVSDTIIIDTHIIAYKQK